MKNMGLGLYIKQGNFKQTCITEHTEFIIEDHQSILSFQINNFNNSSYFQIVTKWDVVAGLKPGVNSKLSYVTGGLNCSAPIDRIQI